MIFIHFMAFIQFFTQFKMNIRFSFHFKIVKNAGGRLEISSPGINFNESDHKADKNPAQCAKGKEQCHHRKILFQRAVGAEKHQQADARIA